MVEKQKVNSEKFNKYFLYQLLDYAISEIRFETSENYPPNLEKMFTLSNFIINIPLKLYNISKIKTDSHYSIFIKDYED